MTVSYRGAPRGGATANFARSAARDHSPTGLLRFLLDEGMETSLSDASTPKSSETSTPRGEAATAAAPFQRRAGSETIGQERSRLSQEGSGKENENGAPATTPQTGIADMDTATAPTLPNRFQRLWMSGLSVEQLVPIEMGTVRNSSHGRARLAGAGTDAGAEGQAFPPAVTKRLASPARVSVDVLPSMRSNGSPGPPMRARVSVEVLPSMRSNGSSKPQVIGIKEHGPPTAASDDSDIRKLVSQSWSERQTLQKSLSSDFAISDSSTLGGKGLQMVLRAANSGELDSFALYDEVEHALPVLMVHLFDTMQLFERLSIDRAAFKRFCEEVERGMGPAIPRKMAHAEDMDELLELEEHYRPYHNRTHVLDVVHILHHLLVQMGAHERVGGGLEMAAGLLAALVHDFRHPGVNNDFLVSSRHPLALRYNHRAVLENFHVASALEVAENVPGCDFMRTMKVADRARLRDTLIELVLATDMARHHETLEAFKLSFNSTNGRAKTGPGTAGALLLLKVALKCADMGHAARPVSTHVAFSRCVQAEFVRQDDLARACFLKRERQTARSFSTYEFYKSQVGFFEVIVLPLFETFVGVFAGAQGLLTNARANHKHWADKVSQLK